MTVTTVYTAGDTVPAVNELQGLNVSLFTGGNADTKFDVAAIRSEDTIIACLNNNAGTITDVASTMSINALNALGTLTLDTVVEDETATVQGVVYTFKDAPTSAHTSVDVGASDTISAANLAAAINAVEHGPSGARRFTATSAVAVVTITATAEGTAGNAYTIVGDTQITASAGTLAGGTATGGVQSTGATNQLIMFWFNKA